MLFLWTTTKLGKIWIDGDAIKQIVAKRLPAELYVQEVSFIGEKNLLNIYITAPDDVAGDVKAKLEERFKLLFSGVGIAAQINWISVAPQDNKKTTPLWTLPLFWAAAAAGVTALFHIGIIGVLWSVFAAVVAYGISWLVITEDGQKQISALKEHFRR